MEVKLNNQERRVVGRLLTKRKALLIEITEDTTQPDSARRAGSIELSVIESILGRLGQRNDLYRDRRGVNQRPKRPHIGSALKGSTPRGPGSSTRATQPLSATKVAALKTEGLKTTKIAKRLKIGRPSVYRLLLGRRGWGRLNEREIATPRDGRWQTSP